MKRLLLAAGLLPGLLPAAGAGLSGLGQMPMPMHGRMGGMMHASDATPTGTPAALDRLGCMNCHQQHEGLVGPAFAWVSWRYRDQPDARTMLAAFIEHGGQGPWSGVMPDLNVPPADADAIAAWILSLPPETPPRSAGGG
ncbi:c-type cytochrome [Rhodanobacter ginsengisoli]|uniref:Cytochrome c-551 n=1 Tax=Rhodanobacter ginsengisoli TaxID=418646 RepID=A0ABW0QTA5_9GAMM